MRKLYTTLVIALISFGGGNAFAQCTTTNATSCVCEQSGQSDCDLLPDITISWDALENVNGNGSVGPTEYSQSGNGANDGRLRVSGSTPNIGHGALNVRGVSQDGYRYFLCGTDVDSIYDPTSSQQYTGCPSGTAQQLILQRVYHKNGNTMTFTERFAGTMTYHPTHGHNHVDDWATFTLRIEDPNEPDPLNWSIVGDGAKVGFCLMDYYACTNGSANGHCRTSQEYQGGTTLNQSNQFDNYGHGGGNYNCSPISQGISVGYTDLYGEWLDGMWVDIPPGTCNGDYWIVMQVDQNDNFLEEDESNNWTAIPFTLTQQVAGGGDFATITADSETTFCDGGGVQLTATAGLSYLWSTGETTQSIMATQNGNYTCTVSGQCGTDASDPFVVNVLSATKPTGTDATLSMPGTANLSATGSDVHWYDDEFAGAELGTGNSFTTPSISTTTSYWAEDRDTQTGVNGFGGKTDNAGGGGYFNSDQWLYFDAVEAFELVSIKVYANTAGQRHFLCTTASGDLIDELIITLPAGEQRVDLNFQIPVGSDHQITLWNSTGSVRDCYRNNVGVTYPYDLQGLGSVTTSTAGTGFYYFCYDWEVDKPDLVCVSSREEVVATVLNGLPLAINMFLEGPFVPGTGMMNDDLRVAGLVPSVEPYTAMGFTHVGEGGGETIAASVLTATGPNAIVDWVLVELRDAISPINVLSTHSALLQRDGDVVDLDGTSDLVMGMANGNYHVAVRHRNHLGCMTASPVALNSSSATSLDLTSATTPTWGTEATKLDNGTMFLWAGESDRDAEIKYTGGGNDRDAILITIGGTVPTNTVLGYFSTDVNMDGVVMYTGSGNDRDPILVNIGGAVPTNTRPEQLPN